MNKPFLLTSLLALALLPLPLAAQTECTPGNNRLTAYMERKNDRRCEGIQFDRYSGNGFDLTSFTIGDAPTAKNGQLTLRIPQPSSGGQPRVVVQALQDRNGNDKYYQLKPLAFRQTTAGLEFQWAAKEVLDKEHIDYRSLRALAFKGAVYLPVVFGSSGRKVYKIVLLSERLVKLKALQIRSSNGTLVYSVPARDYNKGEITLTWNGRNARGQAVPAGRYRLSVDAELKRPADPAPINIAFEHNPQWLK